MSKSYIELNEKQEKNYEHLRKQVDKIYSNKGKIPTEKKGKKQKKYNTKISQTDKADKNRMHLTAKVLAKSGVQNIKNLDQKRLDKVVIELQEAGYSTSTIKNTVAAIQKFNDENLGNRLQGSSKIFSKHGVENRRQATGDRAWTTKEYSDMVQEAKKQGREDVAIAIKLARNIGLRGREICKIKKRDLEEALQNGKLHTVGKGGKHRDIPLGISGRKSIEELLDIAKQDGLEGEEIVYTSSPTLLAGTNVEDGETSVNKRKQSIENWIGGNREKFQDERVSREFAEQESKSGDIHKVNLTLHGLRHTYAQNTLGWLLKKNPKMPMKVAKGLVSGWLGHGKKRSINTYLKKSNK